MAQYSVNWSAQLASTVSTVPVGMCLVADADGVHYPATSANRASYGRTVGIAATAGDSNNPAVIMIEAGIVSAGVTGLAAGSESWVRASSSGGLERVTPGAGDDIVGKARADGSVQISPGVWDDSNCAGVMNAADKTKLDDIQRQGATTVIPGSNVINWGDKINTGSGTYSQVLASGANTFTFSNNVDGMAIMVKLTSDAGGSTVTWPGFVLWPGGTVPTQSSTGVDVYSFADIDGLIYGTVLQAFA